MGLNALFNSRRASAAPDRERIARIYIQGRGIEIGALQHPLKLPRAARVTYVDRMDEAGLRAQYPELDGQPLVQVGVIDDGERLAAFGAGSQDFVIANHFLEHCQDPIGAIENFLRVLRPGGVVYLAVPDKRYIFDRDRPAATIEHLLRDWRQGPEGSLRGHFEEWIRIVHKVEDDAWAENRIDHLMRINYSIHFHAWTQAELLELLAYLKKELGFPCEVELFLKNGDECICVLRKAGEPAAQGLNRMQSDEPR